MPNEATQVEELSLDEALAPEQTGEVKEAPVTEATATTEATTETKETVEAKETATPAVKPKEEAWHLTAVMDEREKRQAAQRENDELKRQLDALKAPKQKTSVMEDEDRFRSEILQEARSEYRSEAWNTRLDMSQEFVEMQFGKDVVAEKVEIFKELLAANPELKARFTNARSPYHELVSIVNKHAELKEMENVDAYKEKLRAEVRAELLKESEEKQQGEAQKRDSITPSLASKRSAGGVKSHGSLIGLDDVFKT